MGKGRIAKLAICLLLVVSTLTLSLSVFADEESVLPTDNPYTLVNEIEDYYWRLWLWGALKSFGINITVNQVTEYTDLLDSVMQDLIVDYLSTVPSISNWNEWILPWVGGINSSGFFEGNTSFVEDVNDFAEYLITKYELGDNGNYEVNTYSVIPVIDSYGRNIYVLNYYSNGNPPFWAVNYHGSLFEVCNGFTINETYHLMSGYYLRWYLPEGGPLKLQVSRTNEFTQVVYQGQYIIGNINDLNKTYDEQYGHLYPYNGENKIIVLSKENDLNTYFTALMTAQTNWTEYGQYLQTINSSIYVTPQHMATYFMPQTMGTIIDTGTINIPSEDSSYTSGKDIIIIDDSPIYIDIEFPDSVNVDNLPAVISPTTITDPDLEGVYGEVTPFIRTFSGGMDMIRSIIMLLPEEVIACLYALMGAIIIFGFIKIMREH